MYPETLCETLQNRQSKMFRICQKRKSLQKYNEEQILEREAKAFIIEVFIFIIFFALAISSKFEIQKF